MNEAKHTPGPWVADLGDQERTSEVWAGDVIIADVHSHVTGQGHADAHLIAAAPDLLHAIKDLVDVITGRMSGETVALANALAAIRKAEGA